MGAASPATLRERRLADLRRERERERDPAAGQPPANPAGLEADRSDPAPPGSAVRDQLRRNADHLAERLAAGVGGTVVCGDAGNHVRVALPGASIPLDRERLARFPAWPPADVPLVCLDTETTGLATAAGTVAFLVGLGSWQGGQFHQVGLLLPDQSDERALLEAVAREIPSDAWLVTYNGKAFDWPLLVARYRMSGRAAPEHAGHLDLLPFVRQVYRHRMSDARLKTVESELLGTWRGRDVDGWEIPGRYLAFLRGAPAEPLAEVVRHNHEDVRSLARLLVHATDALADPVARRTAPTGDLAGLARAYRRAGRTEEALDCLEAALEGTRRWQRQPAGGRRHLCWGELLTTRADDPVPASVYSRPARVESRFAGGTTTDTSREAILRDRANVLRQLGRHDASFEAWRDLAVGGGGWTGVAWVEVAKILEHRRRDIPAALDACRAAVRIALRARALGHPLPGLEADVRKREDRLISRLARHSRPGSGRRPPSVTIASTIAQQERPDATTRSVRPPPGVPGPLSRPG